MVKHQQASAYTAAILYSFIIGLSFLFVKIALQTAEPFDILAHRFTIAFAAATVPILFGWVKLSIRVKDVIAILPLALLYPALFFSFQALALCTRPPLKRELFRQPFRFSRWSLPLMF